MIRRAFLPVVLMGASCLLAGCEKTKQHLRCKLDAHHYPYSCPHCPYYDAGAKAWRPPNEVYTGVPFPWRPAGEDEATRFGTPEVDETFGDR